MSTDRLTVHDLEHNLPVLSIGEISRTLKTAIEGSFGRVRVRGEVSGFKRAASGHLYFTLKDSDAILDGVSWQGAAIRLGLEPEDGMEVIATGRLTTYPGRSKYQIVVESMELTGEGALLKLLEERKNKLSAEGLFNEDRKQAIPSLPQTIGVVTSPTGAVIRDILHRIDDRFPCRVLLWPAMVQGEGAAREVAEAIKGFDVLEHDLRPDVLIVGRGGGSLEDLWAFNEEEVVRAISGCSIPIISAIGHETDCPLADLAADHRAPTPTAAAEKATPVRKELLSDVRNQQERLNSALHRLLKERRLHVEGLARGLPDPSRVVEEAAQRLDIWAEHLGLGLKTMQDRMEASFKGTAAQLANPKKKLDRAGFRLQSEIRALSNAVRGLLRESEMRLEHFDALLEGCSYKQVLKRGFSLVLDGAGNPVTSAKALRPGAAIQAVFHNGEVNAVVSGSHGGKRSIRKPIKGDNRQRNLL